MRVLKSGSVRGMCLALLCLVAVIYPLFAGSGPVNTRGGGDSPFLLVRLEQLVAGLRSGAFPVRWMPDAAYGLGYPFFNFYAALPYYVAAGLRLLGWGSILALQVTQALGFVLAAAAMALLARRVFRHPAAAAVAVVGYTCAPFHLVNVYVRGDSLSEFCAFVFYPLIFWALLALRDRPSASRMAVVGACLGGLILTHNLSAVILAPFVAAWAVFLLASRGVPGLGEGGRDGRQRGWGDGLDWRTAAWMVGGGLLGLALSATLWLAVMSDLGAVRMGVEDIQTSGYFNYATHLQWRNLFQPRLLFDYRVSAAGTPFATGAMQGILLLGALAALALWRRRARAAGSCRLLGFWVAGLALSTFMVTPASRWVWDHLPVLPLVQFPWRFLSVQAFFGALVLGAAVERIPWPWPAAVAAAVLLAAAAVGGLRPEYLPIGEGDVTPERLALFESFTTNIGTTIRGEYLPAGVEPRPLASAVTLSPAGRPPPMVLSGQVSRATLLERDARSEVWQVSVTSDRARLAFATLYMAGWRAYRADAGAGAAQEVEVAPLPGSGLISLALPHGEQRVTLRFERTAARRAADLVSLAALLIVGGFLARALWSTPRRGMWGGLVGMLLLCGVLIAVGRVAGTPGESAHDDLSMDFDRRPFLHHNPQGIDFGGARLTAYDYADRVRGGEEWEPTLTWKGAAPALEGEVCLVAPVPPAALLEPLPPPLACARARIAGQETGHVLRVPADAASGRYYVTLRLYEGDRELPAVNARGETLGTTYLRPVWVDNPRPAHGGEPLLAHFGERIALRDDVVVQADEEGWDVKLTWLASAPIPVNYTCSLRVLGANGVTLAQRDWAEGPGYGFWPTSAWPAGEWLTDRLRVPAPEGVETGEAIALSVVLYDRAQPGFPAAGSAIVPLGDREPVYKVPPMEHRVGATLGAQIVLLGYDQAQDETSLRLTLNWQAQPREAGQVIGDYRVFVHLFDPASEWIAAQFDGRPQGGTWPTPWWQAGEVVRDEVVLSLADVPPGTYRLAVGMYGVEDKVRLPVVAASGETLPAGRLMLDEVRVPAR